MNNEYVRLGIWVAIIAGVFFYLWRKGHLLALSRYVQETREELKKCTWPTWEELRGHTVVVLISILLLGGFTVGVDFFLALVVRSLAKV